MAINLQISHLMIELDSKVVCDMVSNDYCTNSLLNPLILECRNQIKKIPHSSLRHAHREANFCADFLDKKWQKLQAPISIFCSPPLDVLPLLKNDLSFVMYPRTIVRASVT